MALAVREALKQLCVELGWTYAGLWKPIGLSTPRHLICEDMYYEHKDEEMLQSSQGELGREKHDKLSVLLNMMMTSTVHVVGQGLIGEAAATGNLQWIVHDLHSGFQSVKGFREMDDQFVAGIQTIVVIPVLPLGVVQLGSTQMVLENIGFVKHLKDLFMKQGFGLGAVPSDAARKVLNLKGQMCPSTGVIPSSRQIEEVFKESSQTSNYLSNPELKEPSFFGSPAEPWSLVPSRLQNLPPTASELISSKKLPQFAYPANKPVLNISSQVLNQLVTAQALNQKLDTGKVQKALPPQIVSGKNQPSDGILAISSSALKFLEQQLHASRKTASNLPSLVEDSRVIPTVVANAGFPITETWLDSTFYRIRGHMNPLPNSPAFKPPGIPGRHFNSYHSSDIPKFSEENQLLSSKGDFRSSFLKTSKEEDDLVQISSVLALESDRDSRLTCDDQKLFSSLKSCQGDQGYQSTVPDGTDTCLASSSQNLLVDNDDDSTVLNDASVLTKEFTARDCDLFDVIGNDHKDNYSSQFILDQLVRDNVANGCMLNNDTSMSDLFFGCHSNFGSLETDVLSSGMSSTTAGDQLLDAVIPKINFGANLGFNDSASCDTALSNAFSSSHTNSPNLGQVAISNGIHGKAFVVPPALIKTEKACCSYTKFSCSSEKVDDSPQDTGVPKPDAGLWAENIQKHNCDAMSASNGKRNADGGKLNRKRLRTGESPRPRPKDRQMIQDRIKELREIVPDGSKCSIDTLLEKTIKHMLFLQSVTRHSDKLKDTGEPKISDKESGLLLKNFDGGATWAFEVGSQSKVCPIIVEDLEPPRKMLVEMLLEDHGFFLEIAEFIRGLGLTILKGVMEVRKNKIWARFAVEANREVTRMEIFLALVQLLQPSS